MSRTIELLLIGGPHDGEFKQMTINGPTFRTIYQRRPGYSFDPTPVYAEYAIAQLALDNRFIGVFVELVFRNKTTENCAKTGVDLS